MGAPRFFCEHIPEPDATGALPAEVAHHIRVRRLKAGQTIVLFDGSGRESSAVLHFERSGQPMATVTTTKVVNRELDYEITLVQGVASQDRMDWIVEKAVEIGISNFVPVLSERSVVKLSADRAQKRLTHWQKLVISASEQCGRNRFMRIHTPSDTATAIEHCAGQPVLWCHVQENALAITDSRILQNVTHRKRVCLVVGPEGGFSDTEAHAWQAAGAQPVSLGPRVLRTETAGLVAVASLMAARQV